MLSEAQLQSDLRNAMKARAMEKVYILRGLITAIKNLKVEKQIPSVAEADIATLVRKEINKLVEAAEFRRKANRADLVESNEAERVILEAYLPQQLSASELDGIIRGISA